MYECCCGSSMCPNRSIKYTKFCRWENLSLFYSYMIILHHYNEFCMENMDDKIKCLLPKFIDEIFFPFFFFFKAKWLLCLVVECIFIIVNTYFNVPPFASCSSPSSGSAEQFPDFEDANFIPSLAKFPTYFHSQSSH